MLETKRCRRDIHFAAAQVMGIDYESESEDADDGEGEDEDEDDGE